jgi:hypothetical protein
MENVMLSIAKKSVLKTPCLLLSFDTQFPKLEVTGSTPVFRSNFLEFTDIIFNLVSKLSPVNALADFPQACSPCRACLRPAIA